MVFSFDRGVVVLEFDNRFHRDKSLRTCWNGRWMLSLQCLLYPFILLSKPVLVLLFAVTGESRPFCNTALLLKSSAPPSQYTLLTDRALWRMIRFPLLERQPLLLSSFQIGPVHCVIMYLPIFFVHCSSVLRHVEIPLLLWMCMHCERGVVGQRADSSLGEVHRGSCSGNIHKEEEKVEVKVQEDEAEGGSQSSGGWSRRWQRQMKSAERGSKGRSNTQAHESWMRSRAQTLEPMSCETSHYECGQTREKCDVWGVLFTPPVGCSRLPSAVNDPATTNSKIN